MVLTIYPIILTAYSTNEYYSNCSKVFKNATKSLKNKVIVDSFPDQGDWHSNTRKKPEIILKHLLLEKQPIIWIDIDADVLKDVSVNLNADTDFLGVKQEWGPRRTWCVGTLMFNYTERSIKLLEKWVENCKKNSGTDELNLELTWSELEDRSEYKTGLLDLRYFGMKNLSNKDSNTIIFHNSSGNARKKVT